MPPIGPTGESASTDQLTSTSTPLATTTPDLDDAATALRNTAAPCRTAVQLGLAGPSTTDAKATDNAIGLTISHLQTQFADGSWRQPDIAGPTSTALALIGTLAALANDGATPIADTDLAREHQGVVKSMIAHQSPYGSFGLSEGAPASIGATRVVATALRLYLENDPLARSDSAWRKQVEDALWSAEAFIDGGIEGQQSVFFDLVSKLLADVAFPDTSDAYPNLPAMSQLLDKLYSSGLAGKMSSGPAQSLLPIYGLLIAAQAKAQSPLAKLLDRFGGERATDNLVEHLRQVQHADGAFMWQAEPAGEALLALRAAGVPRDDPMVQKAVAFIRNLRAPQPDGTVDQHIGTGSAWKTATIASALHHADPAALSEAQRQAIASTLIDSQLDNGLWSYTLEGVETNLDTSALVLTTLCQLHAHLAPELADSAGAAITSATEALLAGQANSGGWSVFEGGNWIDFGNNAPGPLASMIDGPTPDATAEILSGVLAAKDTNLLPSAIAEKVDRAAEAALAYLRAARNDETGTWFHRWQAAFIPAFAKVLPVLAKLGLSANDPMMADASAFLLAHQNPDGGWGEVREADRNPNLAGQGPSTYLHTASAMIGLMACTDPDNAAAMAALDGAARFLQTEQGEDGTWRDERHLYETMIGMYYELAEYATTTCLEALAHYRDLKAGN